MNVLAIESSGAVGSAAACRDSDVLAQASLEQGMQHGRLLVSLVAEVVGRAGWDKRRDVHLLAVSQGPGSYTGLRVGMTWAKMTAALLHIPLLGVCSLDALAENAPTGHCRVLTVLDARRGEVYAAAYQRQDGRLTRVHGPAIMRPDDACRILQPRLYVIGDALRRMPEAFAPPACERAPEDLWCIRARTVARLGKRAYDEGRRDDPVALQPIYLRRPEAEEKRLARERGRS